MCAGTPTSWITAVTSRSSDWDSLSLSSPSFIARRICSNSEAVSQGLGMKKDTPRLIACATIWSR